MPFTTLNGQFFPVSALPRSPGVYSKHTSTRLIHTKSNLRNGGSEKERESMRDRARESERESEREGEREIEIEKEGEEVWKESEKTKGGERGERG
jgi:hypothetical protein